ncbi:MAG: sugar phosphate isomerase/epimerase [Gemmatales bacterium]|nr:sugar phosphate isomerase/epimerase [Gemmatales bacterium]MDW8386072.1 sugar phosphate isomerase/epimerase [Gemmatales bacterium]
MFVACSTLCFARYPLERALRMIADLEFSKVEIAIQTSGPHLTPAEVTADMELAAQRIRVGPGLTPAAFDVRIDASDPAVFERQFEGVCKLAGHCAVTTVTLPAASVGTPLEVEAQRLGHLVRVASVFGVVLCIPTRIGTVTELPEHAVALCEMVDGLGLTLDPSHYVCGPHQGKPYDEVFPYVRHVHLRDTGRTPDKLQVKIGQGEIEYSRIITLLNRYDYDRLLTVHLLDIPELPFHMETEVRKLKYLLESLV